MNSNQNPAPAPARTALLVVGNVFFSSRLRDTLKHLGIGAVSARSDNEIDAVLGAGPPSLVIADLSIRTLDPTALIHRLKAAETTRRVPIVAFAGHLEGERFDAASKAGADRVVTNGQISADLPGILASLGVVGVGA